MDDLEAELLKSLNGKFFWEPTTQPHHYVSEEVSELRDAQRKFTLGSIQVITAKAEFGKVNTESIKPMTVKLKYKPELIEPIIKAVAAVYDVTMDSLLQKSTSSYYAKAKSHLYWSVFRYIPGVSSPEAGRLLQKNHSTILHGKKVFDQNQDPEKIRQVDEIMGWNQCG